MVRNTIDVPRARLILSALNTAVRNARRVRLGLETNHMVREVPDYPIPVAGPKPEPAQVVDPVVAFGFTGIPSNPPTGSHELAEADQAAGLPSPPHVFQHAPIDPYIPKPPARVKRLSPSKRRKLAARRTTG